MPRCSSTAGRTGPATTSRAEAERNAEQRYAVLYGVTGLGMLTGPSALVVDFGIHEVLLLEGWEILWFGFFWAEQTAERWSEPPSGSTAKVSTE